MPASEPDTCPNDSGKKEAAGKKEKETQKESEQRGRSDEDAKWKFGDPPGPLWF
jgi:hypothetical protein